MQLLVWNIIVFFVLEVNPRDDSEMSDTWLMTFSFENIPLSAESCCESPLHPVEFAAWCCPAGAGAAGPPASSPTPAGISPGL